MSVKDASAVVTASPGPPPPLFSKFKARPKEAESPKSVISDPRIVSPASSASASLERRLTDFNKKLSRHDRVHSISDADDENASPGVGMSPVLLSRQLSSKANNGHLFLESVSEAHSSPSLPDPAASPRNRLSKNAGKDGSASYLRGCDVGEFHNRRTTMAGGETPPSSTALAPRHQADHRGGYRDSFTSSPPKPSNHSDQESDRIWRNASRFTDPRPISSHSSEQGSYSRLERAKSSRSEGKADSDTGGVSSLYSLLKNGMKGPNSDEVENRGRGTSNRPGKSESTDGSPVKSNDTDLPCDDQIELNMFVVREFGGEEINHKVAWSPGSSRERRNSFSGDGRPSLHDHRHSKASKSLFSPGESPNHPPGFNDSPRSSLVELSSDFVMRATAQSVKDYPAQHFEQKDTRSYALKPSRVDNSDRDSVRSFENGRRSFEGHMASAVSTNLFPADGPLALHTLPSVPSHAGTPDGHSNGEKRYQHGHGKNAGAGDTSKVGLVSQHRFIPGQFLKPNPLKPRPQPAKWDDAEKWLVNPASAKSTPHSQYGNGHLNSAGSTPQHISQFHVAASVRNHYAPSSTTQSSRPFGASEPSVPASSESCEARLLSENGDVHSNRYPTNVLQYQKAYDASAAGYGGHERDESFQVDAEVSAISSRDENGARPEDKFTNSVTVQATSQNSGRLVIVMKDAATEITPSTSQRDIATQVTPATSFHAAATPPRIHNSGPARLNTTPVHSERRTTSVGVDVTELQNCHQAKLELDHAASLDSNWTTREEEAEESSRSLRLSVSRSVDFREVKRSVLEARAAAWEEAEQSKYMARYHREEAKILAWEAHEKAKAETNMRKIEVKLERMRSHANELLQNKLATVHLQAENMRAAAAAECGEQAAKTNQWVQEIRTHGRSPSPSLLCCFPRFNSSCSPATLR